MARIKLSEGDYIFRDHPIAEIDPNPPIQRTPVAPRDFNPYAARVFAPVNGTVLRVFDKSERFVVAGTPILELGDPEDLEIVIDILSTDAGQIRPGAAIRIETEGEPDPINARVKLVESQAVTKVSALGVEEQRVNVIGEFLSKNVRFGDNFRVDVRIVVWEADDVLAIPSSALFRIGDDWSVFVVEYGKARRRTVAIGHRNSEDTQIVDGLVDGETVILHPPSVLEDGNAVDVR
jgi:HlyD family secretion protein